MSARKSQLIEEDGCVLKVVHLDRVNQARKETVSEEAVDRLSKVYKAIGDPGRLQILLALRGGDMCVCDLAAVLRASDSAISHQLRRLRDLDLVEKRRDGQVLYYSLKDQHVINLIELGLEHLGCSF